MDLHARKGSTFWSGLARLYGQKLAWGFEWVIGPKAWGLGGDLQIGGDEGRIFLIDVHLPKIVNLYLYLEHMGDWRERKYRQYGFMVFDDMVRVSLGCDEWHEKKYGRVFIWNWKNWLLGDTTYSAIPLQEERITVQMPEGDYPGTAILKACTWTRPRWPWPLHVTRVEIEMVEPIPIPGKGENGWDMDDDAIYSITCVADTITEGIAKLRDDVIKTRARRGGADWQPEGV